MKKYLAGIFSGFFLCFFLAIGGIYYTKNERIKNYAVRVIKKPIHTITLSYHVHESLKNLDNPTEFEKAAAINDYLYQYFVIEPHIGSHAGEILLNKQALCGGHAYCMTELLKKAGVKSKQAFIHGVPTLGSHELVQVFLSNGEIGLFDPTFGIYWKSPQTGKLLSIEELFESPNLALEGIYKSTHSKRTEKTSKVFSAKHSSDTYQYTPNILLNFNKDMQNICYENLFNEARRGGLYSSSQSEFVSLSLKPSAFIGSRDEHESLAIYQNENQEYISGLTRLGVDQEINWCHIYQLSNLEPNKLYTLTLHYWEARNTFLSAFLSGGVLNGHRERTHHISINPESNELSIQIVPDSEEAILFLDNRDGLLLINAIELSAVSPQSKND